MNLFNRNVRNYIGHREKVFNIYNTFLNKKKEKSLDHNRMQQLQVENRKLKELLVAEFQIKKQIVSFSLLLVFFTGSFIASALSNVIILHSVIAKIGIVITALFLIVLMWKFKYEKKHGV